MKRIYEFTVNKEAEVTEDTVETKKDGTEVTTSKKVKKDVPHKFFLRRPNRTMTDEAELYYGVKLAEGIKAGLLTKALLEKRFENDGGTRSDEENAQYEDIINKLQGGDISGTAGKLLPIYFKGTTMNTELAEMNHVGQRKVERYEIDT